VNARRNVPSVDGAFTPGSTLPTAPSRSTSRSSMLSAPVIIPATIEATFAPASHPAPPGTDTVRATKPGSPARRASRITGTNPAEAIRFGSSKLALILGIWNSCIWRMAFCAGSWRLEQSPFSLISSHPPLNATPHHTNSRGGSRFRGWLVKRIVPLLAVVLVTGAAGCTRAVHGQAVPVTVPLDFDKQVFDPLSLASAGLACRFVRTKGEVRPPYPRFRLLLHARGRHWLGLRSRLTV